jgi:hypothetical protein
MKSKKEAWQLLGYKSKKDYQTYLEKSFKELTKSSEGKE